jgi:hypothetical protein
MNTFTKKILAFVLLFSIVFNAMADKGIGRKNKAKITLNINAPVSIRNSISFNLRSGLIYKGSLLNSRSVVNNNIVTSNSIVTYQKGNYTYIIPYKNKIAVAEIKQGYSGLKLIIRQK